MSEELKDNDTISVGVRPNAPKKKGVLPYIVVFLAAVLVALTAVWSLGAFDHYEKPSPEETKADLVSAMSDGEFDNDMVLAGLTDADLSALGEFVRPVAVSAVREYNEQEVLDLYNANVQRVLDQVEATYGEDVPESLDIPELAETVEDLPDNIREGFNSAGIFSMPIANNQVNAFLANDQVVVPLVVFEAILQSPADVADNIHVEVKVLADPSVEDDWKEEVLFSGSASDFVADSGVKLEGRHGLSFLARPDAQVLVGSDGYPYADAQLTEVSSSNVVVYGNSTLTSDAKVTQVLEDRGLFTISGTFGAQDFGMPVFVLRDGEPEWVGVIVALNSTNSAVVASADVVQSKSIQR